MTETFEYIIVISGVLLFYTYAGYPLLLSLFSSLYTKNVNEDSSYQPEITVLISAFNEENLIRDAVLSVYASDYPSDKISVIVGSDGSTDKTADIVREIAEKQNSLKLFEYSRSGKNAVINKLIDEVETEIVCFMDADCRIEKNTISKLTAKLSDDKTALVISSMIPIDKTENDNIGRQGESLYQKYETIIRVGESKLASTVNGLGAFYAIKKAYYKKLPNDLVCDDLFPVYNTILQRKRAIFDKSAITYEVREKSLTDEVGRRKRVTAGGIASVWQTKELLLPHYGLASLFLWSHKVFRWSTPFLLMLFPAALPFLDYGSAIFLALVIIQVVFYSFALVGWILEKNGIKVKILRLFVYFLSMNKGFLLGIFHYLKQSQNSMWER